MKKYARWCLIVCVMAAVGAAVTTAVALASAVLADPAGWPVDYQFDAEDIVGFAAANPEAFARELTPIAELEYPADVVFGYSSWAVQALRWHSRTGGDETFRETVTMARPFAMLRLDRAGWPLRCFESTALSVEDRWERAGKQSAQAVYLDLNGDISFTKSPISSSGPALITNGWVYESGSRIVVVPYGIMWSAFAANTAFFGGTPILAWLAVRVWRRRRWRIAGACSACGYDLAGIGQRAGEVGFESEHGGDGLAGRVCPECGEVNVGGDLCQ